MASEETDVVADALPEETVVKDVNDGENNIEISDKKEELHKAAEEQVEGEHAEIEHVEQVDDAEGERGDKEHATGEHVESKHIEGEHVGAEHVEGEHVEGEHVEGEHVEGEHVEGKHVKGEYVEGEHTEVEHVGEEHVEGEQKAMAEVESKTSAAVEELEEEHVTSEQEEKKEEPKKEELPVEDEELKIPESPPPDPAAPLNLTDSKELQREPFELRPEEIAEIEQIWEAFQDYTPAYTDLQGYITEVELIYMLKALLLMTYTLEQLRELIEFCVRPPHPQGHITYEQFLHIVTLRKRDYAIEDELRNALQVLDPNNTKKIDRDFFKHVVGNLGETMKPRALDKFVAEVDLNNDGELGFEDIYGTMCNDLCQDDIDYLNRALISPVKEEVEEEEDSM